MKIGGRHLWFFLVMLITPQLVGKTWYVRPDGGTRYSGKVTSGQCDGKADIPYGGKGVNQHCAYNDFRYLWDDDSGAVGRGAWVIAGGDTVIVRGCKALSSQQNASNPNCRVGWDMSTGTGANRWCYAVGSYDCYNPPIPAGTASQHTRILGQNYAACNSGGASNPKTYERNLTQIFGGFSLAYTLNLKDTQYVDVQCIELTSHNGVCNTSGFPRYSRSCKSDQPLDDFAGAGILTNNASSHLTLQDVYIHGFNSAGLFGPIGGPISMLRMFVGFNGFAGWNFDDGHDTPDAAGSSIDANYVIMEANGCYEQYPITNAFPAQACYDTSSQGFGDSWSGQDTILDSFLCNHCQMLYNTKDGFIGPHTSITNLVIENSESIGNMGQQWKWGGNKLPSQVRFVNNLTIGNCNRMSASLPGAPRNYNKYLSVFCRAAGDVFAFVTPKNSHVLIANNTIVATSATIFDLACQPAHECGSAQFTFSNNIVLGYYLKNAEPPGMFYKEDPSIKLASSHSIQYGIRSGSGASCGGDIICSSPRLVNEPPQEGWTDLTFLDNFNFHPSANSPAVAHAIAIQGVTSDYFGSTRPNLPSIGATEPLR